MKEENQLTSEERQTLAKYVGANVGKRNPVTQFIKHWKKHGFKQTIKDWKRNFQILQTPELINKQKMQGSIAMFIGLLFIFGILIMEERYFFLVAIGAGIFLDYIQLKQLYAEKLVLKTLKDSFVEVEE